ncbi:hypothetical protein GRI40_12625 [Altererythrobacter aerius]|uniref:FAS1 domain-containing protein n=1 Tax=Tsuneonella aeria TaxID=1837929 RepID=A0A6I4TJ44_9SPHN|nr:fasciclin domain-containing protein [Tsuneonella aeria]MXO76060.1 hypothetical protein [Tsuneonella aeria]
MRDLKPFTAATALALLASLAACSDDAKTAPAAQTTETAQRTLAAAIGDAPNLTTVAGALSESGLGDVFDGPGSYTLLAPDDRAFAALGEPGKALTDPAHRAELVAILRGHMIPGHLTTEAIAQAIAQKQGPVTMRTLADSAVTFSQAGDTITVAGANGERATIDGAGIIASNGVVLPMDGLVKSAEPVTGT